MPYHPRKNDHGQAVPIKNPHAPSPLDAWSNPSATAVVTPDGPMPDEVNGIPIRGWKSAPTEPAVWARVAGQADIAEPEFKVPAGKKPASGAVVVEQDGRVWLAAPTNAFGGYVQTFPKGGTEGLSLQANAIKEAYEEAGLHVAIDAHLIDVTRTTSHTRYYVAHRVGGNPAAVGWESQAVFLAPVEELPKYLNSPYDKPIFEELKQYIQKKSDHKIT